jgi:hypothetical protein
MRDYPMNNVFKISSEITDRPLTVFARDSGHAFDIYYVWRELLYPDIPFTTAKTVQLTVADLAQQPQLAEAAASGLIGVGYFIDHYQGWLIAPPDETVLFDFAPREVWVSAYRFDEGDGEVLLVFATSLEQAVIFRDEWNVVAYGEADEYVGVEVISRWLLTGEKATLRDDMDEGLVGVGEECEDGFWRIFPADYEPTFGGG